MTTQATATKIRQSDVRTVWRIELAGAAGKPGKVYLATTYPNSELVFLETEAGRALAKGVTTKLLPACRDAIQRALSA
jgi:hypothetical protein